MSQDRPKRLRLTVEEVLHELALDSDSEDEPASFDSSDSGWNLDSFVLVFISQIPLFFAGE